MYIVLLIITSILTTSATFIASTTTPSTLSSNVSPQSSRVLGISDSIENLIFKVSVPAKFDDTVTFSNPISAPNLIQALRAGDGIEISSGQTPTITNTGILELEAGNGITVDGNKITNTGILSLTAGTNISIDGNKITNTYEAPTIDYTASGWDTGTGVVFLADITDKVGIGIEDPTSALHVVGASNLAGDVTLGSSASDDVTVLGAISAGSSIIPANDLGADLGSALKRFNNIWAANVNSNSSQSFSGQTTFSYAPTAATLTTGSVIINPTSSVADGQLLGLGIAGYQRALIDEDGDIVLGYNSATSAPVTDYPLNIYGHNGTRVSFIDTSGNGYLSGALGIGTTTATSELDVRDNTLGGDVSFRVYDGYYDYYFGYGSPVSTNNDYLHFYKNSGSSYFTAGGNGNMYFTIAGSNVFTIGSNGKLGIGLNNTSPSAILDVSGKVTGKALAIFNETGNQDILVASASGTNRMVLTNAGNLGVGTTSPTLKLDVAGSINIGVNGLLYGSYEYTPTTSNYINVYNGGDASMNFMNRNNGYFSFTSGGAERVRFTRYGNVGIGTNSPDSMLHVTGAVTGKALAIFNETGDQNILVASASGTNKMVLTNAGYLGLGTTSPSYQLDISNTTSGGPMFRAIRANTSRGLVLGSDGNATFVSAKETDDGIFSFSLEGALKRETSASSTATGVKFTIPITLTAGSDANNSITLGGTVNQSGGTGITRGLYLSQTITAASDYRALEVVSGKSVFGGNVGIGTTSPTSKLHVSGAVTGKALAIFDETGDQNILVASASGTTKLIIDNAGRVKVGDGTSSLPSISFNSDGTKGFYSAGTNTIGLSFQGYNAMTFSPSYLYGELVLGRSSIYIGGGSYNLPNYTFYADSDTGMFWAGANTLGFSTNEIERMRISSTGNLGIGTTSPTGKLHVSGAVTGKALGIFDETGNQALLTASSSGTTKFTVNKNGLVDSTAGGLATYVKAGTISDTDFADAAVNGLMGWDSTNDRLYIRNGDAWEYIAKTGGFQIPDYESAGLEAGDYLMPYVEYKMTDGGVHGLYAKWSDVKASLLSDINLAISSLQSKLEEFKTKFTTKELCINDDSGEVCVTKSQLEQLLQTLPSPSPSISPSPTPTPLPSPTLTPNPSPTASESATIN